MAELIASRSVTLNNANQSLRSPTVNLDKLTSEITVKLRRPTTAQPLSWNSSGRIRVTLGFIVDGVEYKCIGQTSGGIRTGPDGAEIAEYVLTYNPTVLLGQKAREYLATASPDEEGYYNDVPLTRLGETGTTIQGYLLLERLAGTINTVITIAGTVEAPAPTIRHKNSVAFDAATTAVEQFGDGVLSLSHTATGSDRAAFIGVGSRTTTSGAGTTTYAGGGGAVTSAFSLADTGLEMLLYGFYKTAPATTAQTVTSDLTATSTSDHFLGVMTLTGVDQTTPVGTASTNALAFDTSPSTTVASVNAGDMVVDLLGVGASPTIGADQTSRWAPAATSYPTNYRGSTQPGSAGGVMSWTHTGSSVRGLGAIAFKEATGGGGGASRQSLMLMGMGR